MKLLFSTLALLIIVSMTTVAAYEWEVAELGGEDSLQPYKGGEVEFLDDGFTLTVEGGEIWNGKLGCTFVHIKGGLSGDFTIEYTITEHFTDDDTPGNWSKLGLLLLRELDPSTAYLFMQASLPSNRPDTSYGARLIGRRQPSINVEIHAGGTGWLPLEWPMTHKMVREGDVFTASVSLDGGKTYESIDDGVGSLDNVEFAFDDPMIVGFALSGNLHDNKLVKATGTVVDILINGANALAVQPAGKLVTQWAHLKSR